MEEEVYRLLEENVRSHWWNTSKDAIVMDLVKTLRVPQDGNVVDLGAGTGGLLSKLDFKHRFGIDSYVYKGLGGKSRFIRADINRLPLKEKTVDLLLLIDVLEHMQDDRSVVEDCLKALKTNGKLLIFVPALEILWSDLDRLGMHLRRYSAKKIDGLLAEVSIPHRIVKASYANFFLFPFIFFVRVAQGMIKRFRKGMPTHNLKKPNNFINSILKFIFSSERFFLRVLNFPIGVSYICIIEKT